VRISDLDGTSPRCLVLDRPDSGQAVWSPQGDAIAFVSAEGGNIRLGAVTSIFLVAPDGSNARRVGGADVQGLWPRWSPDGLRLVFEYSGSGGGLYLINLDGSDLTKLTDHQTDTTPAWAP
jgi:Tol biopolymer transport system component